MTWRKGLYWVSVVWTVINVAGVGYAAYTGESMHAMVHSAFAVGFGILAVVLRRDEKGRRIEPAPGDDQVEALQDEVIDLHRQLTETQQGLTFAEQLLSQRERDKLNAERYAPPQPDEKDINS